MCVCACVRAVCVCAVLCCASSILCCPIVHESSLENGSSESASSSSSSSGGGGGGGRRHRLTNSRESSSSSSGRSSSIIGVIEVRDEQDRGGFGQSHHTDAHHATLPNTLCHPTHPRVPWAFDHYPAPVPCTLYPCTCASASVCPYIVCVLCRGAVHLCYHRCHRACDCHAIVAEATGVLGSVGVRWCVGVLGVLVCWRVGVLVYVGVLGMLECWGPC